MTAEELAVRIEKNRLFIRGVTCSGGECTLQKDFLIPFFSRVRRLGLSTLLDSNGSLDFSKEPELLAVTDGVLLDVKAADPRTHRVLTGADNQTVLRNATFLAERGKLAEVRVVVAEDAFFHSYETVERVSKLVRPFVSRGRTGFRIIAFRPFGVRPRFAKIRAPSEETLRALKKLAARNGMLQVSIT
jgi:pyruvate formate lyase activating enzyme